MNTAQGGQPPQGQASTSQQQQQQQQARAKLHLFKPEQMRHLPQQFTQQDKEKWEIGLKNLYAQLEKHDEKTPQHQDARKKIIDFSNNLAKKLQAIRQATQGPRAPGQPQPSSQGGDAVSENPNPNSNPQQQQQQPTQRPIPQKILDHVNVFPYTLPPNLTSGTPEASKYLGEARSKYLKTLMAMETATARILQIESMIKRRTQEGNPLTQSEEKDLEEKKSASQNMYKEAKAWVENFRNGQAKLTAEPNASSQAGSNVQQPQTTGANSAPDALTRPQLNPQQQSNPALQSTQTVNAAFEAARNHQVGAGRQAMLQTQQPNQSSTQHAGQGQQIKTEPGHPAQINTSVNQLQNQHRASIGNDSPQSAVPQSGGPHSATTQNPGSQARALSQQGAFSQAARSYSSGQPSGPSVMGHSHPSVASRDQPINPNKMPIAKVLPERATAPPQPVPMPSARPTLSGGPGGSANGVMSQPVIPQAPAYDGAADGDRVLSKKKLDELVRQVTGGGQGLEGGESLSPEVENSIMNVADNFVDQVLQAACRNAKERGSKLLEIRDIQLTLERGWNIRIPGYASDEIRTVRKIQPSPSWISKMSAVQAAKVTGGKNSD